MKIILAQPRGFCAGVDRAINIVERAIELYGAPVYVRHEIVHNKYVVDDLKKKGAVFVAEIDEIPDGGVTIFSAHGVSEKIEDSAKLRDLPVIDATCPLVKKVHNEAIRSENQGNQIILIGHAGHPEVEGTSGRVKKGVTLVSTREDVAKISFDDESNLSYVTQTTLSVNDTRQIIDSLKKRFPNIKGPDVKDICYATQNRQDAVFELAKQVDLILVVGAKNSSNSNRLRDLGEECGTISYLINDASEIDLNWLSDIEKIGVTAGASAPEILIVEVIDYLKNHAKNHSNNKAEVEIMSGIEENIKFKLPIEARKKVFTF